MSRRQVVPIKRDRSIVQEGFLDRLRSACNHHEIVHRLFEPGYVPTQAEIDDLLFQIERLDGLDHAVVKFGYAFLIEIDGRKYGCLFNWPCTDGLPLMVYGYRNDPNTKKLFGIAQWNDTYLEPLEVVPVQGYQRQSVAVYPVPAWYTHVFQAVPDEDLIKCIFTFQDNDYWVHFRDTELPGVIQLPDGRVLIHDGWTTEYPYEPINMQLASNKIEWHSFNIEIPIAQDYCVI